MIFFLWRCNGDVEIYFYIAIVNPLYPIITWFFKLFLRKFSASAPVQCKRTSFSRDKQLRYWTISCSWFEFAKSKCKPPIIVLIFISGRCFWQWIIVFFIPAWQQPVIKVPLLKRIDCSSRIGLISVAELLL